MGSSNLPAEMVEEILLNLPAKSLRRFSSVSKAWESMISDAHFVKRYRRRAALPGRERAALINVQPMICAGPSYCNWTSTSSAEVVWCPFESATLLAYCDELWLGRPMPLVGRDFLFLCNPSLRAYKEIPNPSNMHRNLIYGVGYDSVGDDYKILNISLSWPGTVELYSLASDAWRDIPVPDYLEDVDSISERAVSANGNLYFMRYSYTDGYITPEMYIVCFDLSSEEFGKVALPNSSPKPSIYTLELHLSGLRGKLGLSLVNYVDPAVEKFVLWVMDDSGSWTKTISIKHFDPYFYHQPLYLGENGEQEMIYCSYWYQGYICDALNYVQSLAMWSTV